MADVAQNEANTALDRISGMIAPPWHNSIELLVRFTWVGQSQVHTRHIDGVPAMEEL